MSRRTQKNVGVIGLGIIGRRVAENLRRRGFHVFVWNRTPRPYPNFVGSPGEVAELCDFVQIFVSDDDALLQMVQQMKSALHVQHVIMAHSTVAPHTMRNAAEIVKRRGAEFLDAPFTGSKIPAEKGELVYYVAGDNAAFRRARPVLEASSKEIIEIGEIGQATTVKIATNMVTAATVQVAAEALALVHHAGLSPEAFTAALRGNASNSNTLTMKLPKMIDGDFDPHFSVKHMLKDVQIASRMARSYGLTLGATEAARDTLLEEANSGRGDQDFSSLVRSLFPDGLPAEMAAAAEQTDAQQKLNGVDEEAAAQIRREERASNERDEPAMEERGSEGDSVRSEEVDEDEETATAEEARTDEPAPGVEDGRIEVADRDTADEEAPAAQRSDDVRGAEDDRAEESVSAEIAETTAEEERKDDRDEAATQTTSDVDDEPPSAERIETPAQPTEREEREAPIEDARPAAVESDAETTTSNEEEDAAAPSAVSEPIAADHERSRSEEARDVDDEPPDVDDRRTEESRDEPTFEDESPGPEAELAAQPEERRENEPASVASTATDERASEPREYQLDGEPPTERRANGEREAARPQPAPDRDEAAQRRSFLSRMFGKGDDY